MKRSAPTALVFGFVLVLGGVQIGLGLHHLIGHAPERSAHTALDVRTSVEIVHAPAADPVTAIGEICLACVASSQLRSVPESHVFSSVPPAVHRPLRGPEACVFFSALRHSLHSSRAPPRIV